VWIPPPLFKDITTLVINQILNDIDAGLQDGNRYSNASKADERAAWPVVARHCPEKNEEQCRRIISAWIKSGLLSKRKYNNPAARKEASGLWVDNSKRPI